MLFTCIKSWFFRNHLANFHQISHWSFCWNVIDSYSNDHAPLTVGPIYSSSKLRTAQMMIFSLVAIIGLEKCCITSACLQWLCHSGERTVARGPLVFFFCRPRWLSWMRRLTGDQEVAGSTPSEVDNSFVEIDHEIFSTVILSLRLIQEGQLSVSGERMCTILVNRLED